MELAPFTSSVLVPLEAEDFIPGDEHPAETTHDFEDLFLRIFKIRRTRIKK